MNTKTTLLKVGALLLVLLFFSVAEAQEIKWPVSSNTYGRYGQYALIRQGYIVLVNRDTVKGFIRFSRALYYYPVLDTTTHIVRNISFSETEVMRLYDGPLDGSYTDWFHLPHSGTLWKVLAKKNDVALYENVGFGPPLILVTPNEKIKLIHKAATIIHNDSGYDAPLIRFIRKRYKSNYTDFGTTGDIYTYIVEKENEKIATTNGTSGAGRH